MARGKFQAVAEDIASRIVALPTDTVEKAVNGGMEAPVAGITPVEIIAIVEIVMQVVQMIVERCKNRPQLVAACKSPRLAHRVYVRSVAHEVCASREDRKWSLRSGVIAAAVIDAANRTPEAEVTEIVDEVSDPINNWLI